MMELVFVSILCAVGALVGLLLVGTWTAVGIGTFIGALVAGWIMYA